LGDDPGSCKPLILNAANRFDPLGRNGGPVCLIEKRLFIWADYA
jgi:hypothetical protein